ncbi:hypothetical protein [Spirillospora sp. CA-128828]|uniref:hypothetical protein n=1 Tax=Spirillospora sp. CA-128828 TaxID=3240033 RepID=UPI003D8F8B2B
MAVAFSSVMSTYALWFYDDAELVRHVWFENGKATTETGDPLPSESGAEIPSWGPDEDSLWHVIKGTTGLKPDLDQIFTVFEVEDS